jgi:hypothetical protein
MRFKLLGVNVSAHRVRGTDTAEHDRLIERRERIIADEPNLAQDGRARYSAVGELDEQGWTGEQIARLVSSWPDASAFAMSMIISLAGRIAGDGVEDPDQVVAWTHAMLEQGRHGRVRPNQLVRSELASTGRSLPRAVELWTEAAGSGEAGLAALAAGHSLNTTREGRSGR